VVHDVSEEHSAFIF